MSKVLRSLNRAVLMTALLAGAACAPRQSIELERARVDLEQARSNPTLVSRAPLLLEEAEQTYALARAEWEDNRNRREAEHLAYLTARKLDIAREEARREIAIELAANQAEEARLRAQLLHDGEFRARMAPGTPTESFADTRDLVAELKREIGNLRALQTERGLELTVTSDVLFDADQTVLRPAAHRQLTPLVNFMRANPERTVVIEGHTDALGAAAYNAEVSKRRAEAVRDLLASRGIPTSRIITRGMGEEYPVATNETDAGRLQNRRVQIILSGARQAAG